MKAVLVLAILAVVLVAAPSPHSSTQQAVQWAPMGTSTTAPGNAILWGTASMTTPVVATFWQNQSMQQYGQSTPARFVAELPPVYPVSNIVASSLYLTEHAQTGLLPVTNASQGNTLLANLSLPYAVTLYPAYSATLVTVHTASLIAPTGQYANFGVYSLWYNGTTTVQFVTNTTAVWSGGGVAWKFTYPEAPPVGWSLGPATLFIPFPGVAVNLSTVRVTLNSTAVTSFVAQPNGLYLSLPSLAQGGLRNINVTLSAAARTTGPVPVVTPVKYSVYGVNTGLWQFNVTWTNAGVLPYAGAIYINVANLLPGPIAPTSLTLTANNSGSLAPGTYAVVGSYVEVLPGSLTVLPGNSVRFNAVFSVLGGGSQVTSIGGIILLAYGGWGVTVGAAMLWFLIGMPVALGFMWLLSNRLRDDVQFNRRILIVYAIIFVVFIGAVA